ncbi:thioesterase domain-containing protein [Fulvivirga maritima]|uniref:thioesterase II family protein n=1 Tax=Fulvivirga maritima TaxID=2904247 RepID=UPI001F3DAC22|nr:alpha/beta fold hydrolase [Fulvivirga maritima]UII24661.1 thioesterase domain-containing protein [Fulvivirga maritima]
MDKIKLFCFPYAGGSASIFYEWKSYLSPHIEIIAIELKGRGRRIKEDLYDNVDELIDDIFSIIKKHLHNCNYAFFGHSMGAMIAYELTLRIKREKLHLPVHLFVSGRGAPHIYKPKNYHLLDDKNFEKEILKLGGTPPEFFDYPELLEIFLPLLKNDFKLSDTKNRDDIIPIETGLTAFFGNDEDLTLEQIEEWRNYTSRIYEKNIYPGGHFFIKKYYKKVIKVINSRLSETLYK